jgi:hypothetical protein
MPANLIPAAIAPGTVLPQALCSSFVSSHIYPLLSVTYNDGTYERSLIQDGVNPPRALRTWAIAERLTTAQLATLWDFWTQQQGGLNPFYFYDPYGVNPGQDIGSNYDPSGDNTQGRVVVFFRGDWSQQSQLARHTVPSLTLVEAA